MNIISCVSNNWGITFNKKRVSKDSMIIKDIEEENIALSMNGYSYEMFKSYNYSKDIVVSDKYIDDTYFFSENNNYDINSIDNIIIYKFNRSYPSDINIEVDFNEFDLISTKEFTGTSHDKITKEVYKRK